MDRRTFLAESAAILTAVSGGCTTFNTGGREGVILTHVELGNHSDEAQAFDVQVIHDDEVIHWTQRELASGGDEVIEIDSPDEHGSVEVFVRVEEQWDSTDFDADEYDGERVIAVVTYGKVEPDALRISWVVSDRPASDNG